MAVTLTKKILIILGIVALSFVVLVAVLIGLAFYVTSDLESDKDFQRESQANKLKDASWERQQTSRAACEKVSRGRRQ